MYCTACLRNPHHDPRTLDIEIQKHAIIFNYMTLFTSSNKSVSKQIFITSYTFHVTLFAKGRSKSVKTAKTYSTFSLVSFKSRI
jgi:hypothetical protein